MSRSQNLLEITNNIKEVIERCIQKYMSLEQTITYLHENHYIDQVITSAIWEALQKDNPDFFKEYNKRCEVARQIATFNDLLAQQVDLMHRLRKIELSYVAPVNQLQQPTNQLHHHDQVNHQHQDLSYDQWIASNEFAYIENSISSFIDPSWVGAPQPSDMFNYCTDFQDLISIEQFTRDLDQEQQILQLQSQQPQHLTDQQVEYCPQEHDHTTLPVQQVPPPQSLASLNSLDFGDEFINNNGLKAGTESEAAKEIHNNNQ